MDKFRLLHFPWDYPDRLGFRSYLRHTHTLFCNAFLCDMLLCGMFRCDFCCGHYLSPFELFRWSCATHNSHLTISKISTNSLSYRRPTKPIFPLPQQSIRLIYFRLFTQAPPINVSKKCAFFASLRNFSEFLRVFAFSPLIFSQFGHLAQKPPLPIHAICPILTHVWRASIKKSPCKFSISPISTGLKLGISPETHLQIPVLSLIGARHLPHADQVL